MIELLVGDCRETLPTRAAGSVQACITSPPYWGLRDYGTPPLLWGGDPEHAHEWTAAHTAGWYGSGSNAGSTLDGHAQLAQEANRNRGGMGSLCACGAWQGSLGLEPTPELYVEHLVECFRHVWRVLRDDGVLWLNLGDSYAGSGKGPSNSLQPEASQLGKRHTNQVANGQAPTAWTSVPTGYKPKDLLLIPFRVAMALQADGWYVRSVIPWLKRNSMPESVQDRPTTAVEYVLLLARSRRYSWDPDTVRESGIALKGRGGSLGTDKRRDAYVAGNNHHGPPWEPNPSGRNRRNADWFFESWQGLLFDDNDDPLALVVNPAPYVGAHYATFPPRLIEPMVKASTRLGDTLLDPFAGAGTVGLVADRLGRGAILCELKPDYADQADARLVGEAPLFATVRRT